MPWFNCTSSMLMNVQLGGRCVKPSRVFLSCRNTDMFHTCTTMTWSHYIIHTQGEIYWKEIKTSRFGSACSTLLFFILYIFLSFVSIIFRLIRTSVLLRSSWTASDEGKSVEGVASPQNQTRFSSTSDKRWGVKSLTEWLWRGVALYTLEWTAWCTVL